MKVRQLTQGEINKIKERYLEYDAFILKADGWTKVVFADECIYEDWDEDRECPECPQCGKDYADCPCPGPTMEDEYDYKEVDGILYAKRKA